MQDFLALATGYREWPRHFEFAAGLSSLCAGSLTGLFVSEPIVPLQSIDTPLAFPEMYTITADLTRQAREAEASFLSWAAASGARQPHWLVAEGSLSPALAHAGNWHDLLFVESGGDSPLANVGSLGQILLTCGLPCIVVPQSANAKPRFDTVVVAWKGTAESVRAVHAALPLLRRARRIVLVHGEPKESYSSVDWTPQFDINAWFARHELKIDGRTFQADGEEAGAGLLLNAYEAGADLLVMGAYGRSRFSEWILGGATRHVLQHARLPLFLRH